MNWLKLPWRKAALKASTAAPAPPAKRKITSTMLDAIGPDEREGVDPIAWLRPAAPPTGVMPEGGMAMDSAIGGDLAAYAAAGLGGMPTLDGYTPWLGYPYLSELSQRPEYRRMTETLAKQMTRKWLRLTSSGEDSDGDSEDEAKEKQKARAERIAKLDAAMKRFKVRQLFRKMAELDAYFGRGQLYIDLGTADNDVENQTALMISKAKIKKGSLKGFTSVEPIWTYPANFNAANPLAPDFYKPQAWYVYGKTIHHTRMLTFIARPVPDILKPAYSFGGLSLSQLAKPYVDNWLRTRQAVSDLIDAFSVMILKTDMAEFTQGHGSDQLLKRIDAFNRFRSNRGMFVVDKNGEEFANVAAPIAGLDKLQAQAQEQQAAVCGIPLVILLGITPSGLNASSEGEIRAFYDWVEAQQEDFFGPHIKTVLDVLQLNEFGDIDESISYEWVPLWQMDALQRAQVRKTQAETAGLYIEQGVLAPAEERERVAREDESDYAFLSLDDDPSDDLESEAEGEPFNEVDSPPEGRQAARA